MLEDSATAAESPEAVRGRQDVDAFAPRNGGSGGSDRRPDSARGSAQGVDRTQVRRVSRLVRSLSTETQVYADLVCRLLQINRTDLTALGHLERSRVEDHSMTQADLGRVLRMSGAAITALADRLERTGHLRRTRSNRDRRKILLASTEHSREVSRESFGPLARSTRAALDAYSDEELQLVGHVLEDLVEASREASRRAWQQGAPEQQSRRIDEAN